MNRIASIAMRVAKLAPKKLYHATLSAKKIVAGGFKIGMKSGFGGSSEGRYISFTTKENVKNYAEGLRDMIRAARGEYRIKDVPDLFKKWNEHPLGIAEKFRTGQSGHWLKLPLKFNEVECEGFGKEYFDDFIDSVFFGTKRVVREKVVYEEDGTSSVVKIPLPELTKDEEIDFVVAIVHEISVSSRNAFPWIVAHGNEKEKWSRHKHSDVKVVEVTLRTGVELEYHSGEEEWRVFDPSDIDTVKVVNV